MSNFLRKVFSFILVPLEKGDDPFEVNPLSRKVLIVMGCLFLLLGSGSFIIFFMFGMSDISYVFPACVFSIVGILCLIVGCLGSDRAVAKIWGNGSR